MRVERAFSPQKIIIESEEDQRFILNMIQSALSNESRAWLSKDNLFKQRLQNLYQEIRL